MLKRRRRSHLIPLLVLLLLRLLLLRLVGIRVISVWSIVGSLLLLRLLLGLLLILGILPLLGKSARVFIWVHCSRWARYALLFVYSDILMQMGTLLLSWMLWSLAMSNDGDDEEIINKIQDEKSDIRTQGLGLAFNMSVTQVSTIFTRKSRPLSLFRNQINFGHPLHSSFSVWHFSNPFLHGMQVFVGSCTKALLLFYIFFTVKDQIC